MLKLLHICTHFTWYQSNAQIFQVRFQQYMNHELPDVQAGFRKGRGVRDQIANICWIIEKTREFQKYIYFCFIDYAKTFDCVDHNKLGKILKEMVILDHLTCLLRNPYARNNSWNQTWNKVPFANKGLYSQSYGFPVVMPVCEHWTIKKAEH